jgi:hypothetical protein
MMPSRYQCDTLALILKNAQEYDIVNLLGMEMVGAIRGRRQPLSLYFPSSVTTA